MWPVVSGTSGVGCLRDQCGRMPRYLAILGRKSSRIIGSEKVAHPSLTENRKKSEELYNINFSSVTKKKKSQMVMCERRKTWVSGGHLERVQTFLYLEVLFFS